MNQYARHTRTNLLSASSDNARPILTRRDMSRVWWLDARRGRTHRFAPSRAAKHLFAAREAASRAPRIRSEHRCRCSGRACSHWSGAAAAPMEDGWVEYVDPATGHPYLYHAESGESRWVVAKPPGRPRAARTATRTARRTPPPRARGGRAGGVVLLLASSSSSSDERGISDDEFDDPDLEAKFRRMLETPEGREAVDAERARAERLVDRRERELRGGGGGGGRVVAAASCGRSLRDAAPEGAAGVIRWGWNRAAARGRDTGPTARRTAGCAAPHDGSPT